MIVALGEVLWDLLPTGPRAGGAPFNFAFHCHQARPPGHDRQRRRGRRPGPRSAGRGPAARPVRRVHPDRSRHTRRGRSRSRSMPPGVPTYRSRTTSPGTTSSGNRRSEYQARSADAVCFGTLAQRRHRSGDDSPVRQRGRPQNSLVVCDLNLRPPFVDRHVIYDSVRLADWLKVSEAEADAVVDAFHLTIATGRAARRAAVLATPVADGPATGRRGVRRHPGRERVHRRQPPGGARVPRPPGRGRGHRRGRGRVHRRPADPTPGREVARRGRPGSRTPTRRVVASKPGGTPRIDRAEVERLL